VALLISSLTRTIYYNISRALFNQHKKIFSFIIAARVQEVKKIEYNYFNKGNFSLDDIMEPPKTIQGLSTDASVSLFNLPKVFNNNLFEMFSKPGGEKLLNAFTADPLRSLKRKGKVLTDE
jgi:hypothetical protein